VFVAGYISFYYSDYLLTLVWLIIQTLALATRGALLWSFNRRDRTAFKAITSEQWLRRYYWCSTVTGALWGCAIILVMKSSQAEFGYVIIIGLFALAGAAIVTIGSSFKAYVAFLIALFSPLIIWAFTQSDIHILIGIITLMYFGFLASAVRNSSQDFMASNTHIYSIKETQIEILNRLGMAIEFRDEETGTHITRMSQSSYLLAQKAGLPEELCEHILDASPMHDVGKIGIPDAILLKPGKLSADEWEIMKTHTTIGEKLLAGHDSEIMNTASLIAGCHHEKWNGKGYPRGISGTDIPIEGRITAICDVFDALTSQRPYKKAWSTTEALALIEEESSAHFDPELVVLFLSIADEIVQLREVYPD